MLILFYFREHEAIVNRSNPRGTRIQLERIHSDTFADWFAEYVSDMVNVIADCEYIYCSTIYLEYDMYGFSTG